MMTTHEDAGTQQGLGGLAEVLASHANWRDSGQARVRRVGLDERWFCSCGHQLDDDPSGRDIVRRHRAHLADAVLAWVLGVLEEPEVVEAGARAIQKRNYAAAVYDFHRWDTTAALAAAARVLTERAS